MNGIVRRPTATILQKTTRDWTKHSSDDYIDQKIAVEVTDHIYRTVGRGGALVETMTLNWRVVGLTPALAAM